MTGKCELCGIETNLTLHHLVPRVKCHSAKYDNKLKNDESNHIMICNECHSQIHAMFSENELRDFYNTKEKLLENENFNKFVKWRIKHPDFKGSSKMSNRRR